MSFFSKQFIDVIQWTEPGEGILAYRYPMEDMEIQNGGQLTVRDSQMAIFVNEGQIADVFEPGLYTLTHADAAHPDVPEKLGQGFQVALQVGRLFLLHAAADQPEVGHHDAHHHPRQGIRRGALARVRDLLLPHPGSQGLL